MKAVEIDHFKQVQFISRLRQAGETPAFLLKQANFEENRYNSDLWVWRREKAERLTATGNVNAFWWLNEDTLVFSRPSNKKDEELAKEGVPLTVLQKLSLSSPGEAQEFLRLDYDVEDVAFLKDGRMLFVALFDPKKEAALQQAEGDTARAGNRLKEQEGYEVFTELPYWGNGEGFTNGKRHRLYLYDGGEISALSDEKTDVAQLRLSKDERYAFFVACRYEKVMPPDNKLMRLSLEDYDVKNLAVAPSFTYNAYAVLDNDSVLVFGADRKTYGINQNGSFYRYDIPARSAVALYEEGLYNDGDSVGSDLKMAEKSPFAATEEGVYWVSSADECSHLFCIDPHSGEIRQMTNEEGDVMEFCTREGRVYISAMRGLYAGELYELAPDGSEVRLTDFNTALREEYTYSEPERLQFVNGEGDEIRGFLLRPVGFKNGQSYPCILDIHGGPKTVYGPVLFHEMQYWANRGFAVLFCNPTGSDGRGDAFADIRGRYGLVDYDDLMAFVDKALALYTWIDAARLGVTGGSYGGYMTNWIIGHTGRFAAAASQRSISNWVSMANTSDIGYYFEPDQAGTDAWEDEAALWEQSPLKYANQAATPTLFIHSDEDYRCPLPEALQMYTALQVFGVETRMCLFHGENHELSRSGKPKNRVKRLEEITEWMEKYLCPAGRYARP